MKSLNTTRRPAILAIVSLLVITIALSFMTLLVTQSKAPQVSNVSELFITDPVAERPTISITPIETPASELGARAVAVNPNVAKLAATQSYDAGSAVSYPTLQISTAQRDRLLGVAASIAIIGLALYTMTFVSIVPRPAPVTRRPLYKVFDT